MPEILTESFCERCGTRYTFQAAAAARGPLTRVRTLSKGFRNYVLSDESSLSEAMANARSEDLRRTSGEQLDAFHKAFNFCMSCRQYTCANCWNDQEGRCLSCAPTSDAAALVSTTIIGSPFPIVDPVASPAEAISGNGHAPTEADGHVNGKVDGSDVSAWPSIDLEIEANAAPPTVDQHDVEAGQADEHPSDASVSPERFAAMFGGTPLVEPAADAAAHVENEPEVIAGAPDVVEEMAVGAPVVEAASAGSVSETPVTETVGAESGDTETPAVADGTPAAAIDEAPAAAIDAAEPAVETPPVAADQAESDLIPDIEGWAASAAAQTSTLLGRFRAFPGRHAASAPPTPAAAMPEPVAAAPEPVAASPEPMVVADAAPEVVEPLAVPLRTAALDVVPVIALAIDTPPSPTAVETPASDSIVEPASVAETPTPAVEPEPIVADGVSIAAEPEPPIVDAVPVAAEPEPAPEQVAATAPVPEPEPEPVAAAAPTAEPEPSSAPAPTPTVPPVPVWQIVAPDAPAPTVPIRPAPNGPPTWPPLTPPAAGDPQWPAAPAWPSAKPAPTVVSGADAVWAQSSRDLLNRPETGVQACVNCGLPLSARARFCRRCGTNQLSA